MSQPHVSVESASARDRGTVWLQLGRVGFVALGIVCLIACVLSIPSALARFGSLCTTESASACPDGQATASAARALQSYGISLREYAFYTVTLIVCATLIYVGIAALIFWRRSHDWMGLFTATFLLTFGIGANGIVDTLAPHEPAWAPLLNGIIALGNVSIVIFFAVFPNGHFVPRWTAWVVVASLLQVPRLFVPALQLPDPVSGLLFVTVVLLLGLAAIYRYRSASTMVERQQTKWVVFGAVLTAVIEIGLGVGFLFLDSTANSTRSVYDVVTNTAYILVPLAIPLSIGVAILRYRLWDIDVIINRALVYGSLTALLAAVYVGLILSLESVAEAAGGQPSQQPIVLVVSTLAIAALFQPLRRRLQRTIDRRFFRAKYDAAQTLATFGAALRKDVDLVELSDHLVGVVEETMHPTHVSLWLRAPESRSQGGSQ